MPEARPFAAMDLIAGKQETKPIDTVDPAPFFVSMLDAAKFARLAAWVNGKLPFAEGGFLFKQA